MIDPKEEIKHIDTLSNYELVQYLQNGLVSYATGQSFDDNLYQYIRQKLLKNHTLSKQLPQWIRTSRDLSQFWGFIKTKFATYAERREFIWKEFSAMMDALEFQASPIEGIIIFDENQIHELWKKALERKASDPEGAITIARTLVESTFKHILEERNIEYGKNMDLSELYKKVSRELNLASEQHQEQVFKQILGSANGIISGLGELRNKLGDAHGKGKIHPKPKERHSELAVNLAGTMALFLFKTYQEQKDKNVINT